MTPGIEPVVHSRERDIRALVALLDSGRLSEKQSEMIESMRTYLVLHAVLTKAQREVIDDMIDRLDLRCDIDPPAELTPAQRAEAVRLGPMKIAAGPMVLKPPGRR